MSTTTSQQSVSTTPTDSADLKDDELLEFAKTDRVKTKLAAFKRKPEDAFKPNGEGLRKLLVRFYHQAKEDEAKAEDAAVAAGLEALFEEDFLGVTPAMKKAERLNGWVTDFGRDQTKKVPVPTMDAEGKNHVCAMAGIISCCDGKSQVNAFAFTNRDNTEFYGICQDMVLAFQAMTKKYGLNPRFFFTNLAKAQGRVQEAKRRAKAVEENMPTVAWVYSFAKGEAKNGPVKRRSLIEGKHFCSLPTECCNHEEPVRFYTAHDGVVYGLCQTANDAYWQYYKETGRKAMKPVRSLSEATDAAANQIEVRPLVEWVDQFVSMETAETGEEPVRLESRDGEGNLILLCGTFHCCDHTQPAVGFTHIGGMVYGICKKAAWAYCEGRVRHNDPECLMFTKDIELAEKIAANWRDRNIGDSGNSSPRSPLGNETTPEDSARRKANVDARRERDKTFRKDTRGSGKGSGKNKGK